MGIFFLFQISGFPNIPFIGLSTGSFFANPFEQSPFVQIGQMGG